MTLWQKIEPFLPRVHAPSQYIGSEWNAVAKDHSAVAVRVALGFPDCYRIGMSHLGLQILYGLINGREDALCERFFAPWPDMEEEMRARDIPLFTVDSHRPVREFDLVGFSLQTELGYTNVVRMLRLAGIPVRASERGAGDPIVVGGGPNATHPGPVEDFFDALIVGDGEVPVARMVDLLREMRGEDRDAILRAFSDEIPGVYVPARYSFEFNEDNTIRSFAPERRIGKALVDSLDDAFHPTRPIVPYTEVVFDRINLEIMRGCPHRCRFCQAVSLKNRLRLRSVARLVEQAEECYENTGYDEIALISLSSGDYPPIHELLTRLNARFRERRVGVSMPSLRVDEKLAEVPRLLATVRKAGFTLAPEGGSEELRRAIRKPLRDEDLFETARAAFRAGWNHVKLYFMVGLPGELEEDYAGIIETAKKVSMIGREIRGKPANVNVTVSPLVPKPHTPFQFVGQKPLEETVEILERLRRLARGSRVHLKAHDAKSSFIEAALARGDRRLSKTIEAAVEAGCMFDEWREHFSHEKWIEAFARTGFDARFYAGREIGESEVLPWDPIDTGVSRAFLWREVQEGRKAAEERRRGPEGKESRHAQETR